MVFTDEQRTHRGSADCEQKLTEGNQQKPRLHRRPWPSTNQDTSHQSSGITTVRIIDSSLFLRRDETEINTKGREKEKKKPTVERSSTKGVAQQSVKCYVVRLSVCACTDTSSTCKRVPCCGYTDHGRNVPIIFGKIPVCPADNLLDFSRGVCVCMKSSIYRPLQLCTKPTGLRW